MTVEFLGVLLTLSVDETQGIQRFFSSEKPSMLGEISRMQPLACFEFSARSSSYSFFVVGCAHFSNEISNSFQFLKLLTNLKFQCMTLL
jgi:hypothetical protein